MKTKIAIGLPVHDYSPSTFTADAMSLCAFTGSRLAGDYQLMIRSVLGTYVHIARGKLLEHLLEQGADYLLWMDGDMRFPQDALFKLMAHQKPIVGINYVTRRMPNRFVTFKKTAWNEGAEPERLETRPSSTGIEEVEAIGFGLVLMDLRVIKPVLPNPAEEPWFAYNWNGQNVGEDVYFCRLMGRAGIPIYVDHDLSKECGHSGLLDFHCEHGLLFDGEKCVIPPELEVVQPQLVAV